MPRLPYSFPAAGESSIADVIRQRRGDRGLTPLDGALLNAPEIAGGWNNLLGAVRTRSKLPGDLRELMICRVAARNSANYEWIHHERAGRDAGLTTAQLAIIRDVSRPGPSISHSSPLTAAQAAALAYADAMTVSVRVEQTTFDGLKHQLKASADGETTVEKLMTEATATVATYNMVSRFLVALNVADANDIPAPFPGQDSKEQFVDIADGVRLRAVTTEAKDTPNRPWIVFINSLMTDLSMWDGAVARLSTKYNILRYDQRGHGKSSIPPGPCDMDQLADDIKSLLISLSIPTPVHAVIGISQGGATALNFAIRHTSSVKRIVACDTQITSPKANTAAWDERIKLAQEKGMSTLAEATVARWCPAGSDFITGKNERIIRDMIISTPIEGFTASARALQGYDLAGGISPALKGLKTLLVAGDRDAGGKIAEGLQASAQAMAKEGIDIEFFAVPGSGHLPPLDGLHVWATKIEEFLN